MSAVDPVQMDFQRAKMLVDELVEARIGDHYADVNGLIEGQPLERVGCAVVLMASLLARLSEEIAATNDGVQPVEWWRHLIDGVHWQPAE